MQYEYIGHTPNRHEWIKGQHYNVNPRREKGLVICNIQEVQIVDGINVAKPVLRDLIYDSVDHFRKDWKVVSAELIQDRTETVELTK